MAAVSFHYWAGARAAAGTTEETVTADTVAAAVELVCARRPDGHFARVVRASALLIDGTQARAEQLDDVLQGPVTVEVLPPFAGGSGPQDRP